VFVRAEGLGWRNVGTVRVDSQNEYFYSDITFSSRNITGIFVVPPSNHTGSGSFNNDIVITDLIYNGQTH
jgi:hypothetical protein